MKIAVVYFSGTGNTRKTAESVAEGAKSVTGAEVALLEITGKQIVEGRFQDDAFLAQLDGMDAIVFGSPTYMGMASAAFKAFAEASAGRWMGQAWKDKICGGFTSSGSPGGDRNETLHYFFTLAMQHAMIWVGQAEKVGAYVGNDRNIHGYSAGAVAIGAYGGPTESVPSAGDLATMYHYGLRIAEWTAKIK
jgi:NAD(P)H dehydrogenase (quinone)